MLRNFQKVLSMRAFMMLLALFGAPAAVLSQQNIKLVPSFRLGPKTCRGADLSVRYVTNDSAMGGHNLRDYALRNNSASACTLTGYPRFELLSNAGKLLPRGRAINSTKLPGDEATGTPEEITLESGKEALFRVYYNSGGAGYTGKPCPKSRKVRITAPGTTQAFILKEEITSCQSVQVSPIRKSTSVT